MKRVALVFIGANLLLCPGVLPSVSAQPQESKINLYSINKHRGEGLKSCLNFKTGPTALLRASCDLRYGALYAGDDLDWFESSTAEGNRSVIKDLGDYPWTAKFQVPLVEPLPKLKPGERRQVTIDTSGADGADGAPGMNADGTMQPQRISTRPKRDGQPKTDPLFVKAIVGHLYVIHIVDDSRDFYALFRVEALERGDYCTVSWRLIPEPVKSIQ
jgi:hypothetical protein